MNNKITLIFIIVLLVSCKKEENHPETGFAAFKADTTSIQTGDTIRFTDLTTDGPYEWYWRFPGGSPSFSNVQHPVVVYNTAGQYNVFLKVANSKGIDSVEKINFIHVAMKAPVAAFSASETLTGKGDTVQFTDESLFFPAQYHWVFQGGTPSHSTDQNPRVVYSDTGHFNVTLTVSNAAGSDSLTKTGYIRVVVFICGRVLTDIRDGKKYPTVKINQQCWMKKNLNYGSITDSLTNQTDNALPEKYCYRNNESFCDTFGALYQWKEAMQYTETEGTRGICPSGWHIPTDNEWYALENYIDPSVTNPDSWGLRGTNIGLLLRAGGSSGFEALLGGFRDYAGSFSNLGTYGFFWVSKSINANNAVIRGVSNTTNKIYRDWYPKDKGYSVRCIKD